MEETYTYIESFFSNQLSDEEKKAFENRCQTDTDFAQEVAFYVKTKYGFRKIQKESRKEDFEILRKTIAKKNQQNFKITVWATAACLFFISIFGWWYLSKPTIQDLAGEYAQENFITLSSSMDASSDSLQKAIKYYNEGKSNESLRIFEEILLKERNPKVLEYSGIALYRKGEYDKAIERFRELEKLPLKSNMGAFYQVITLLKRNKKNDLKEAQVLIEKIKNEKLDGWQELENW